MTKHYDFEFYSINPTGDWSLYLIKHTDLKGRRDLLRNLKEDGYVFDRSQNAYFKELGSSYVDPVRFAFVITLHK